MFSAAAAAVQSLADLINDVHVFDFNTVYDASATDDGVDVAAGTGHGSLRYPAQVTGQLVMTVL